MAIPVEAWLSVVMITKLWSILRRANSRNEQAQLIRLSNSRSVVSPDLEKIASCKFRQKSLQFYCT